MFRAHRSHPENDFTILANGALQDERLSLLAIGLLSHLLSLKDGSKCDTPHLSKVFKEGKQAIDGAKAELRALGYMTSVKTHNDKGQVVTAVDVYDVPQVAAFLQVAPIAEIPDTGQPDTGQPDIRIPGNTPKGVKNLKKEPNPNPNPSPVRLAAVSGSVRPAKAPVRVGGESSTETKANPVSVALIASLRGLDDRLTIATKDLGTLAPLVDEWFARGCSADQIQAAITHDLPEGRLKAPAKLVAYRLTNRLPLAAPAVDASPKRVHVAKAFECDECARPWVAPGVCSLCAPQDHQDGRNAYAVGDANKWAAIARQSMNIN